MDEELNRLVLEESELRDADAAKKTSNDAAKKTSNDAAKKTSNDEDKSEEDSGLRILSTFFVEHLFFLNFLSTFLLNFFVDF